MWCIERTTNSWLLKGFPHCENSVALIYIDRKKSAFVLHSSVNYNIRKCGIRIERCNKKRTTKSCMCKGFSHRKGVLLSTGAEEQRRQEKRRNNTCHKNLIYINKNNGFVVLICPVYAEYYTVTDKDCFTRTKKHLFLSFYFWVGEKLYQAKDNENNYSACFFPKPMNLNVLRVSICF